MKRQTQMPNHLQDLFKKSQVLHWTSI